MQHAKGPSVPYPRRAAAVPTANRGESRATLRSVPVAGPRSKGSSQGWRKVGRSKGWGSKGSSRVERFRASPWPGVERFRGQTVPYPRRGAGGSPHRFRRRAAAAVGRPPHGDRRGHRLRGRHDGPLPIDALALAPHQGVSRGSCDVVLCSAAQGGCGALSTAATMKVVGSREHRHAPLLLLVL